MREASYGVLYKKVLYKGDAGVSVSITDRCLGV